MEHKNEPGLPSVCVALLLVSSEKPEDDVSASEKSVGVAEKGFLPVLSGLVREAVLIDSGAAATSASEAVG